MGQTYQSLQPDQIEFIKKQPLFFVATAARDGRVNLSPKGLDSLKVHDDNTIIWLNVTGSGNETAAHILEMPRMTIMWCAFEGSPQILRAYGAASLLNEASEKWGEYIKLFPPYAGARQIFVLNIDLVLLSCGMGVPIMEYKEPRAQNQLEPYFSRLGKEKTLQYQQMKNKLSLDGKPTDIE